MIEFISTLEKFTAAWFGITLLLICIAPYGATAMMQLAGFLYIPIIPLAAMHTMTEREKRLRELSEQTAEAEKQSNRFDQFYSSTASSGLKTEKVSQSIKIVDINSADEKDIAVLPFVGPIFAKRIVQERAIRSLNSLDELQARCGLQPHVIERLKPLITFGNTQEKRQSVFNRFWKKSGKNEPDAGVDDQNSKDTSEKRQKGRIIDF